MAKNCAFKVRMSYNFNSRYMTMSCSTQIARFWTKLENKNPLLRNCQANLSQTWHGLSHVHSSLIREVFTKYRNFFKVEEDNLKIFVQVIYRCSKEF